MPSIGGRGAVEVGYTTLRILGPTFWFSHCSFQGSQRHRSSQEPSGVIPAPVGDQVWHQPQTVCLLLFQLSLTLLWFHQEEKLEGRQRVRAGELQGVSPTGQCSRGGSPSFSHPLTPRRPACYSFRVHSGGPGPGWYRLQAPRTGSSVSSLH